MRYALINEDVVVNVIEADETFIGVISNDYNHIVPIGDSTCGVGYTYISGIFQEPIVEGE